MKRDLRRENLIWTMAQNHRVATGDPIFENRGNFQEDFYPNALEGFSALIFKKDEVNEYFQTYINSLNNRKDLRKVAELIFDHHLYPLLKKYRPGAASKRLPYFKDRLEFYDKYGRKTFSEEIEYTYFCLVLKKVPMTTPLHVALAEGILDLPYPKDTEDLLEQFDTIFHRHFYISGAKNYFKDRLEEEEEKKTFKVKRKKTPKPFSRKSILPKTAEEDLEKYLIESAEFTMNLFENMVERDEDDLSPTLHVSSEKDAKTADKVKHHYGRCILPQGEINALEEKFCTGIHRGIRLFTTRGEFEDDIVSRYYRDEIINRELETKRLWNEDATLYRRAILQLMEILKKSILQDLEDEVSMSTTGTLIPSKLWRQEYLGDGKIFQRTQKNDYGTLSVDILLDASGSQDERQSEVAIQAYIITEALTKLNIPTRVLGFHNLFNYLVFREFRDYNDPISKNRDIFQYHSSGSNRDGLAIKVVAGTMQETSEHQILIVLNDGKPNDKVNIGMVGEPGVNGINYEGQEALMDTAKEVLQCRLKGLSVLGVFTGEEEDVSNQQFIYGTDFAYITDLERFSPTVGMFLKSLVDRK
ncbi:MAG: hypothetical protein Q4Q07_01705 [Tissierellia bacterium]|nr:hypothetical protein [Tissierellia bacterium]